MIMLYEEELSDTFLGQMIMLYEEELPDLETYWYADPLLALWGIGSLSVAVFSHLTSGAWHLRMHTIQFISFCVFTYLLSHTRRPVRLPMSFLSAHSGRRLQAYVLLWLVLHHWSVHIFFCVFS